MGRKVVAYFKILYAYENNKAWQLISVRIQARHLLNTSQVCYCCIRLTGMKMYQDQKLVILLVTGMVVNSKSHTLAKGPTRKECLCDSVTHFNWTIIQKTLKMLKMSF
jgi:hypothetical protein